MENKYEAMSLAELRAAAKEKGISGISGKKKQELVELLQEQAGQDTAIPAPTPVPSAQPKNEPVAEVRQQAPAVRADVYTNNTEERRTPQYRQEGYRRPMERRDNNNNNNNNRGGYERREQEQPQRQVTPIQQSYTQAELEQLDSGETKEGILEIMQEGYGFIRCDNFLPGENDVYVSHLQIRRMNLKTGDIIVGNTKIRGQNEKFSPLLYAKSINGLPPAEALRRPRFEDLTPIFPNSRIHLETPGCGPAMRMVDLVSPIGKGQRGMIVSQPKAGKTTLLKQIAKAVNRNHPDMHMIILLIDERPEEVTDMKESIQGDNVEVIYSTFDELPDNHKRVSEMVIERAKRLVEHGKDVIILLDSITRLARAYNLTVQASGRTLSGGLDPAALHMPKRFFGAARNMREGGSLTILATALVETGSRMDDVVFEEFKGTGNMELVLDRNLSEKRVFPAIDLPKSSTRRDDLLLTKEEAEANFLMRRAFNGMKSEDAVEKIIQIFSSTKNNKEFIEQIKKTKIAY
ncbi:MAG: transcription termination factor Rho [Lachnospiraceae bacterium]|nr:transcription termination factor Rho [Lachnospiraceae bacterium]